MNSTVLYNVLAANNNPLKDIIGRASLNSEVQLSTDSDMSLVVTGDFSIHEAVAYKITRSGVIKKGVSSVEWTVE